MPTKNTTTNTAQFDPNSKDTYNSFLNGGSNVLRQDISNPMSQIGFNQRIAQGNQNLFNNFQRMNSNVANRASLFGGQTPGFASSQLNRNQRALSAGQNQNFNQNLLYADQVRQNAASQMLNFRPLQTGSTSTQQQSGLGTWLPQVASMGLGIATGGMSSLAGGASKMFSGTPQGAALNAPNQNFISQMPTNMSYSNAWLNQ
jgi:hypothetical protein